jgi:hypothetical protein
MAARLVQLAGTRAGGFVPRKQGAAGNGGKRPMLHGPRGRLPVTSHTHRNDGSQQEKDGPELGGEFSSR